MQYWLMKTEPEEYSIKDLKRLKTTRWEGVRNFQARNFMQAMRAGDQVLFYHSSTEETGIYGLAQVTEIATPDKTQFDPKGHYYDKRSTKAKPLWMAVEVGFVREFNKPFLLRDMRKDKRLAGMRLLQKGQRLSVQPVSKAHFEHILKQTS